MRSAQCASASTSASHPCPLVNGGRRASRAEGMGARRAGDGAGRSSSGRGARGAWGVGRAWADVCMEARSAWSVRGGAEETARTRKRTASGGRSDKQDVGGASAAGARGARNARIGAYGTARTRTASVRGARGGASAVKGARGARGLGLRRRRASARGAPSGRLPSSSSPLPAPCTRPPPCSAELSPDLQRAPCTPSTPPCLSSVAESAPARSSA